MSEQLKLNGQDCVDIGKINYLKNKRKGLSHVKFWGLAMGKQFGFLYSDDIGKK